MMDTSEYEKHRRDYRKMELTTELDQLEAYYKQKKEELTTELNKLLETK